MHKKAETIEEKRVSRYFPGKFLKYENLFKKVQKSLESNPLTKPDFPRIINERKRL